MGQLSAVTGRRIKPNYVDIINQQKQFLPTLYGLKSRREHQDKMYDLDVQSMNQAEAAAKRSEALYSQDLEDRKKQAKKARTLGWVNTGVSGLSALGNVYNAFDKDPVKGTPDLASVLTPGGGVGPVGTPGAAGMAAVASGASSAASDSLLSGGLGDLFDIGKSIFKTIGGWF